MRRVQLQEEIWFNLKTDESLDSCVMRGILSQLMRET